MGTKNTRLWQRIDLHCRTLAYANFFVIPSLQLLGISRDGEMCLLLCLLLIGSVITIFVSY